jgi:integrase/recombinase XerD
MNVKVDVKLRKDRADKKGLCPLQLTVTIIGEDKRERKALSVRIHPDDWDEKLMQVKDTAANHKTVNQFIRNKVAEYEKHILQQTIVEGTVNTTFVKELMHDGDASKNFFTYANKRVEERFDQGQIKWETKRQHVSEISKMKKYHPAPLRFADITPEFLGKYRKYLFEVLKNEPNTQWKTLKFVRTYFNQARTQLKLKHYPFTEFKFKYHETTPVYLTEEELKKVQNLKFAPGSSLYYRLNQFLFSCFVGFRFADLKKFVNDPDSFIQDGRINLVTNKQEEPVWLPITSEMKRIIDIVRDSKVPSLTHYNRGLKEIALKAEVDKDFTSHMGRHTVGVTNAENGIDINITKKILGHRKLSSTEIYYTITDKLVAQAMEKRNDMFKRNTDAA